jgi:large subunit ribosomal protein L20
MPRAKRGVKARRRRNRILKQTEGFFLGSRNKYSRAVEVLHRAWKYAFRDRKARKRDFRSLWITRIAAGAKSNGLSYSRLIHGLQKAQIRLDRKVLSDLATFDPPAFTQVVKKAASALTLQ